MVADNMEREAAVGFQVNQPDATGHVATPNLSDQGRRVLQAVASTTDGQLTVCDLIAVIRQPSTSLPVARASVSRTLRRLWAARLVELVTHHPTRPALTDEAAYWRSLHATVQAAPDDTYRKYRAQLAAGGDRSDDDRFGSAAALVAAFKDAAACPHARVHRVRLTPQGRAVVNNGQR